MLATIGTPELGQPLPIPQLHPEPKPQLETAQDQNLTPPVPESLEDAGIPASVIEQLIFKLLYFRGDMLGRDLSTAMGLKFSLIEDLIEAQKRQHAIQVKRSLGMGNSSAVFSLSEVGRNMARECLETNQYTGPAPVPLYQYNYFVRRQRRQQGWLTMDGLRKAYRKMVISPRILSQIGPAVSSGNSFLIYGQPGNGKTYLAEALANLDDSCIYVPHAIECQGTIIQVFDPIYRQPVQDEPQSALFEPTFDGRWIKCRRPFIKWRRADAGDARPELQRHVQGVRRAVSTEGEQRHLPD